MNKTVRPDLLEYPLDAGIRAFSTRRDSGVGQGAYAGFNITHYCGDDPEHVSRNRHALCRELGITDASLHLPWQTHDAEVMKIDQAFLRLPTEARAERLHGIDALITDESGQCIGVSTADCIPILLHDPVHHAVAAIHAGWRGTVKNIVECTISAMQHHYGTQPHELRAVIGPGISCEAFEVGDEVYEAFAEAGFPMPHIARRMPAFAASIAAASSHIPEKWHIDLWAANAHLLETAGLPLHHIMVSGICTYTHHDTYFSARRLGIKSGRIFTGIMMK